MKVLLFGSERGANAHQGHKNGLSLVLGALVEKLVVEVLEHGLDLPKLLDLAFERDEVWFVDPG
jgi:hypothetical protein